MKLWLETTTSEQKRIAYDSLTLAGDIGGFYDFIVIVVAPFVGLIVGDRLSYYVLNKLFMVNKTQRRHDDKSDSEDDKSDPDTRKKKWKNWIESTEPYKTDWRT